MTEENNIKEQQLAELNRRRSRVLDMGGADQVERQKKRGKFTARERIEKLLDPGSFQEIGMFTENRNKVYGDVPSDCVITGYGKVDGRKVFVYSQDFTSMGGTLSENHARKIALVQDDAMKSGCPLIGINDSGGARIQDGVEGLVGFGEIFRRNTHASGMIPQICAIIGPCAGGAVYSPALMDFIFMVKGTSYAFITGPKVVKATIGEEISEEELGGATAAQTKAGVVARSENNEDECFNSIKELLSYLPLNCREKPPRIDWGDNPQRTDPELFNIVPANSARSYDMHKIIKQVFDQKSDGKKNYFELFPQFAGNIITCFSRLNGYSVGIIANNPGVKAGCLDINASDKASRFIRFCDAFNIPVISLVDVPGYLPGTDQEWGGIIRHGAKMLYAYSEATVPKLTLTLRKAYGGSYIGMCSKELGADFVFCWPNTELAVMGPDGAAQIIYRKELEAAGNSEELLAQKTKHYREEFANPYKAASNLRIDDVIDPAQTRIRLISALEMMLDKQETRPAKKHGVMPT